MWTQKECSVRNTLCVIKFLSSCLLVIYTGKVLTVTLIGLVCQFDVQKTRPVSLSHPGLHKRITCYYGFRLPVSRICLLHNGFWIICRYIPLRLTKHIWLETACHKMSTVKCKGLPCHYNASKIQCRRSNCRCTPFCWNISGSCFLFQVWYCH